MDLAEIERIIASNIFPIIMCFILLKVNEKQDERHNDTMKQFSKALANNTEAVIELKNAITSKEDYIE